MLMGVRLGKGRKDRVVPLTQRVLDWLDRYQLEVRPSFLDKSVTADSEILFLSSKTGKKMHYQTYQAAVKQYMQKAIHRKGSCHLIRHTVATLLLENGCDIRYVQELLGHKHLQTTQIYTRVSITALKENYNRYHPTMKKKKIED